MKKIINYTLYLIICLLCLVLNTKADSCTYKEQIKLNKEATNVKKSYVFIEDDPLNYHFLIHVTNITDNLRVEVTNDYSSEVFNITSKDLVDGVYTIKTHIATRKVTYTFNVYASSGACSGEKLGKYTLTTPRYNPYSTSYVCEQVPEYKYCGKFAATSSMTYEEFIKKATSYRTEVFEKKEEKDISFFGRIKTFLVSHKIGVIVSFIAILIFVIIFALLKIKGKNIRRSKNEK